MYPKHTPEWPCSQLQPTKLKMQPFLAISISALASQTLKIPHRGAFQFRSKFHHLVLCPLIFSGITSFSCLPRKNSAFQENQCHLENAPGHGAQKENLGETKPGASPLWSSSRQRIC